jgi:hypothetical protein
MPESEVHDTIAHYDVDADGGLDRDVIESCCQQRYLNVTPRERERERERESFIRNNP